MKKRLTSRFLAAIFVPLLLITSFYIAVLFRVVSMNQSKISAYGESIVEGMALHMELTLQNMMNSAKTFSYSETVQSMAERTLPVSRTPLTNMVTMARAYNPDLLDVMLTDMNNNTYSLVGYLSSTVEGKTKDLAKDFFTSNSETRFAMFADSKTNAHFIVYFMPVFATQNVQHYGQKVGTITILCRAHSFIETLDSAEKILVQIADIEKQQVLLTNHAMQAEGFANLSGTAEKDLHQRTIAGTSLQITGAATNTRLDSETGMLAIYVFASLAFTLLLFLYIVFVVNRLFIQPIKRMNRDIAALESMATSERLRNIPQDEIGSIGVHINNLLNTIYALNTHVAESRARLYQTEIMKKKAQLYAYQSQINPHFLYNMLQCMRGIALHHDMEDIADICTSMAGIFRYSIKGEGLVPLEKELEIIDMYLFMIRVRFQDSVSYTIDVPAQFGQCKIPKLTLQPLVENAVFHGLAPLVYQGNVRIDASQSGELLLLRITNNGVGIEPEKLAILRKELACPIEDEPESEEDVHLGLLNVHNKIRLYAGMEYGLVIDSNKTETVVTLQLPLQFDGHSEYL